MNFQHLKYFCDAVKLGGVTAASKANFVTQSAVSQGITKLEESLGCSLINRHPNQFRLTPEGEKAFLQLSDILKRTTDFEKDFSEECKNDIGSLDFACIHSFALAVIPQYLQKFRLEHPKSKIQFLCSGSNERIMQMIKMGKIDFGIVPDIGTFPGFIKQVIYEGSYGLYTAKDKKEHEFILPAPEDTTQFKELYRQKYQKEPNVILEIGSWEIIANLVIEGLGIGYFPDYIARRKESLLETNSINLELPKYRICAIYPERLSLRRSSECFLSYFNY